MPNPGPKFTDYGLRAVTGSLTKEEQKDLHKWRMKNDPDYREKVKVDRIRKKAATKKTPAPKPKTSSASKPKTSNRSIRSGAGLGGMFGVKNR